MNPEIEKKLDQAFLATQQRLDAKTKHIEEESRLRAIFEKDYSKAVQEVIIPSCSEYAEMLIRKGRKCVVTSGCPTSESKEKWRGDQVNFHLDVSDVYPGFSGSSLLILPRVSFTSDNYQMKVRVLRHAGSINGSPFIDSHRDFRITDLSPAKIHEELTEFIVQLLHL
jgi:hypothetical protein